MVSMAPVRSDNSFWADKATYDDAERIFYEKLAQQQIGENLQGAGSKKLKKKQNRVSTESADEVLAPASPPSVTGSEKKDKKKKAKKQKNGGGGGDCQPKPSLASEVAKAREHLKTSLESVNGIGQGKTVAAAPSKDISAYADALAATHKLIASLEKRVAALEIKCSTCAPSAAPAKSAAAAPPPPKAAAKANDDDDDDVDLFGSESEDEDSAAKEVREKRLADYNAKKSKKPALIAKSSIILDVKPWDDETDMKAMEEAVRKIEMKGLLWGASKLVPLAYGIKKLQITCVVVDDLVSVDLLTETIEGIEDLVQSVDIAAFNKI